MPALADADPLAYLSKVLLGVLNAVVAATRVIGKSEADERGEPHVDGGLGPFRDSNEKNGPRGYAAASRASSLYPKRSDRQRVSRRGPLVSSRVRRLSSGNAGLSSRRR